MKNKNLDKIKGKAWTIQHNAKNEINNLIDKAYEIGFETRTMMHGASEYERGRRKKENNN